jgi:hypothetical protein
MATAETVVGYEFSRGFYADGEHRRVLKNGEPLSIPLTQKEYEVLEFFLKNPKEAYCARGGRTFRRNRGSPSIGQLSVQDRRQARRR